MILRRRLVTLGPGGGARGSRPVIGWHLDEGPAARDHRAFAAEVRVLRLEHVGTAHPLDPSL